MGEPFYKWSPKNWNKKYEKDETGARSYNVLCYADNTGNFRNIIDNKV